MVQVCVENVSSAAALSRAEGLSSKMFATAGITIDWRRWYNCPSDGIRIRVSQKDPQNLKLSKIPVVFRVVLLSFLG